jgi:glycosyltransferase involved in cell wall biosynthesis
VDLNDPPPASLESLQTATYVNPGRRTIRVVWLSDSPLLATGFGRVTAEVLRRLAVVPGVEVACLGLGYDGWPFSADHFPARIYPSPAGGRGEEAFGRVIEEFRPDVVITLAEIWRIDWLLAHPARGLFRWIAYLPLDGGPFYPPWEPMIKNADEVVAMSDFGQEVFRTGVPSKHIHRIYHGVNSAVFRPLPEREQLKSHERFRGKFVVGCVARNQPRKNIPALVKAFAMLSGRIGNMHLLLHMNACDVGYDIVTLLRRYRLEGHADVSGPDVTLDQPLPDDQLNRLYNLFDVTVLPSGGEGFGLPILESLAAGVPVVATDYSACPELVRGRGELVRPAAMLTVGVNLIEHAVIDVEDLSRKIEKLYRDSGLRRRYGEAGRAFAEGLSWDALIPEWVKVIRGTAGAGPLHC